MALYVEKPIVPPFLVMEIPACGGHDAQKDGAVVVNGRRNIRAAMRCALRQIVKSGAPLERGAAPVDQRQIDRDAA